MAAHGIPGHESIHRQAFAHYLRTGQRLTNEEWLDRQERKFNPYHDEIGRFTSPPGATVSWGRYGGVGKEPSGNQSRRSVPPSASPARNYPRTLSRSPGFVEVQAHPRKTPDPRSATIGAGFRSDFVRDAVSSQTSHANSLFELSKRQVYLNTLRQQAGLNPSAAVRADLDDFQQRLDADAERLKAGFRLADSEISEILRAGAAPYDVAAGSINIISGKGEVRDYISVSGVIPVVGMAKRIGGGKVADEIAEGAAREITPLAGPYWKVKKVKPEGYHSNHIPPKSVIGERPGAGTAIGMPAPHHKKTASYGSGPAAREHRAAQKELFDKGKVDDAIQMDIDDIRAKHGDIYDETFRLMRDYNRTKGGKP